MHETCDWDILNDPSVRSTVGPRLGIVGSGQLARITAMATSQFGCDVVVLERHSFSPAAALASHSLVGDWTRVEALLQLAAHGFLPNPTREGITRQGSKATG